MRLVKKSVAYALVAAMVVTLAPSSITGAAKKVKLSKKTASIGIGETVKIKVKNAKKSAKVTWKSNKAKVAKIKKSTKKGNASATIVGVKKGTAVITATVKNGKKKNVCTCKVTVNKAGKAETSQTPVTPTQPVVSAQPTGGVNTPEPTKQPSPTPTKKPATPKPTATPSPTPLPDGEYKFEEVTNGIPIDISTFTKSGGYGAYNKDKDRVEINDTSANDASMGAWAIPETIPAIKDGDLVTFRVQGFNYGTSGFRFWIGNDVSGSCTPVQLTNEIDENFKIGECGYPCVVDADGNEVANWTVTTGEDGKPVYNIKTFDINGEGYTAMNQMAINPDKDTKAFDITFTFKAGASQNDTGGVYSHLTLKHIMSGGTAGYIDGLCIKKIYYINPETPTPPGDNTDDPSGTDTPSEGTDTPPADTEK